MLAWLAALLFALAAIITGGGFHPSTLLLSWQALACTGMACLALHAAWTRGRP
jgi:hypothetical protein